MDDFLSTPIRESKESEAPDLNNTERSLNLKSLRESKGVSLRDLYIRTRISKINLESLENELFDKLPPPVITRAFIKAYAKELEIEDTDILKRYEKYINSIQKTSHKVADKEIIKLHKKYRTFSIWGLSVIIVAVIIAFSISSYKSYKDIPRNHIKKPASQVIEAKQTTQTKNAGTPELDSKAGTSGIVLPEPNKEASEGRDSTQVAKLEQTSSDRANIPFGLTKNESVKKEISSGEMNRLIMEAKELTWIRITTDHGFSEEILLRPGDKIEREAPMFKLIIGNAGGLSVKFQGKCLGSLGRHGQVVHLKLP